MQSVVVEWGWGGLNRLRSEPSLEIFDGCQALGMGRNVQEGITGSDRIKMSRGQFRLLGKKIPSKYVA